MNEDIKVTKSCGCVGCDLGLPVVDGMHGAGTNRAFPCDLTVCRCPDTNGDKWEHVCNSHDGAMELFRCKYCGKELLK